MNWAVLVIPAALLLGLAGFGGWKLVNKSHREIYFPPFQHWRGQTVKAVWPRQAASRFGPAPISKEENLEA